MVDRLFWRAGFGPTRGAARRLDGQDGTPSSSTGSSNTPSALEATTPPPLYTDGTPIDPLASDTELELEWIDRMQRAVNPLPGPARVLLAPPLGDQPRRRASRSRGSSTTATGCSGTPTSAANPDATFRQLAYEMTTADAAMSLYLNMNQNVRGKPNENYAREFMELFCLGPTGPDGTPNYTQDDVAGLAKAFTAGPATARPRARTTGRSRSRPSRYELGAKTFLGLLARSAAWTQTQANAAGFGPARDQRGGRHGARARATTRSS